MLQLLDQLAGWWLDRRTAQAAMSQSECELMRADATPDGMLLLMHAPGIAILADQAAALLNAHNAENYLEFDMMPRLDRARRPIRITVQWANGLSPAEKNAALSAEIGRLHTALEQTVKACIACDDGYVEYSPSGLDAWLPTGAPNIIEQPCPYCGPAREALGLEETEHAT